jgi:hypothetical protein
MKQFSDKKDLIIIYLDQFATNGIVETDNSEWRYIKELIYRGVKSNQIICPMSIEHLIESSQKDYNKAKYLDNEFYKLSGGYAFKPEMLITPQLTISLLRGNNITLRTFLYENINKNILSDKLIFDQLDKRKKILNIMIHEATIFREVIRKDAIRKNQVGKSNKKLFNLHKQISIFELINRLEEYLSKGFIFIRGIKFSNVETPDWIDQLIFQLRNKHKITMKEVELLIKELKTNGFDNIPSLDIRSSLSAYIAVLNKKMKSNDQIDILRISTGLPLSDLFFTDKPRKSEIVELGFDKKYDTQVFTSRKEDLQNFINELEQRL